jgi:hypothetical protein
MWPSLAVASLISHSAYEISTFHKREPPPKEILEDLTAKGGDLLNRTLENYHRRAHNRDVDILANGIESDTESNEHTTPKADRMDLDEAPGSSGRVTRGTRLQPSQDSLTHCSRFAPRPRAARSLWPAARIRPKARAGDVQQFADPRTKRLLRLIRSSIVDRHVRATTHCPVLSQGRPDTRKQSCRLSRSNTEAEGQAQAESGHRPCQRHDDAWQ